MSHTLSYHSHSFCTRLILTWSIMSQFGIYVFTMEECGCNCFCVKVSLNSIWCNQPILVSITWGTIWNLQGHMQRSHVPWLKMSWSRIGKIHMGYNFFTVRASTFEDSVKTLIHSCIAKCMCSHLHRKEMSTKQWAVYSGVLYLELCSDICLQTSS